MWRSVHNIGPRGDENRISGELKGRRTKLTKLCQNFQQSRIGVDKLSTWSPPSFLSPSVSLSGNSSLHGSTTESLPTTVSIPTATPIYFFSVILLPHNVKPQFLFSFKTLAIFPFHWVSILLILLSVSNCSNLYTADGHVSQPISYFNSFNLQDHSQHPPYVPPCNLSFIFFVSLSFIICLSLFISNSPFYWNFGFWGISKL